MEEGCHKKPVGQKLKPKKVALCVSLERGKVLNTIQRASLF